VIYGNNLFPVNNCIGCRYLGFGSDGTAVDHASGASVKMDLRKANTPHNGEGGSVKNTEVGEGGREGGEQHWR